MAKELDIQITNHQDELLDDIDFLSVSKKPIPKKVDKEEKVLYKPVKKDFVKVDRWVIDLVIPFLNSNCSPGVSILYLDLYRMTYGYGRNNTKLTDEIIEKRTAIPNRTIMSYKKELIKYDLLKYKKGHRTTRGEFIIKRPEQSSYFIDYIQKSVSLPTKNVGNASLSNTIYNKDNMYIDSKTLIVDFYKKAGWKETSITREHIDKGIKVVNKLLRDGYEYQLIEGLSKWTIDYCKQNNKEIYGIGFISYLLPEYVAKLETAAKSKKRLAEEKEKQKLRDQELEQEHLTLERYKILPKHIQSQIMTKARNMVEEYISSNKITKFGDYTEKYLIDGFIIELMETEYKENR